jgi:DNA-binding NtrC family response regulator
LGKIAERTLEVLAEPTEDPECRVALAEVGLLVQTAVDLCAARRSERDSPVVWPDETPDHSQGLVLADERMIELIDVVRRLATSSITVLITGETGTGKELLARALHDAAPRKHRPFVPFNCSSIPRDLADAQLFGYRRGAFTGAVDSSPGIIRTAAGGTLFLDEIGDLALDVQPKLLRFLESGEIHPLGDGRPSRVDVRVVCATNANLEKLVAAGTFREDLFYRLNVVQLEVPPLRERRVEIPLLVQHYLERCSREARKTGLRFAEETMEYLILYKWPGNVRQLANEVRRLVALAETGAVIMPEHLSREIAASRLTIPPSERALAPTEFVVRMDQPMAAAIEHVERTLILNALRAASGRVEDAAQILGLSRKGLYLKRQRLQIDTEPDRDSTIAAAAAAAEADIHVSA